MLLSVMSSYTYVAYHVQNIVWTFCAQFVPYQRHVCCTYICIRKDEKQQQQTTIMAVQLSSDYIRYLHWIMRLYVRTYRRRITYNRRRRRRLLRLLYYVRCVYHHAEQHLKSFKRSFLHILNISKNPHVLGCLFSVLYTESTFEQHIRKPYRHTGGYGRKSTSHLIHPEQQYTNIYVLVLILNGFFGYAFPRFSLFLYFRFFLNVTQWRCSILRMYI